MNEFEIILERYKKATENKKTEKIKAIRAEKAFEEAEKECKKYYDLLIDITHGVDVIVSNEEYYTEK